MFAEKSLTGDSDINISRVIFHSATKMSQQITMKSIAKHSVLFLFIIYTQSCIVVSETAFTDAEPVLKKYWRKERFNVYNISEHPIGSK